MSLARCDHCERAFRAVRWVDLRSGDLATDAALRSGDAAQLCWDCQDAVRADRSEREGLALSATLSRFSEYFTTQRPRAGWSGLSLQAYFTIVSRNQTAYECHCQLYSPGLGVLAGALHDPAHKVEPILVTAVGLDLHLYTTRGQMTSPSSCLNCRQHSSNGFSSGNSSSNEGT